MNINIETTGGSTVLVNWDNVNFVQEAVSAFGSKPCTEIHFTNKKVVGTFEMISSIENKLKLNKWAGQQEVGVDY
jgi:hypothetical protein